MKHLIFFFVLISLESQCQILHTNIDSLVDSIDNKYNRKYRVDLNKSDTVLIDVLVSQIRENCNLFDTLVRKGIYSNYFVAELVRSLVKEGTCLKNVFDNIDLYLPIEPMGMENWPIGLGLWNGDEEFRRKIKEFLLESNYLSKCKFIGTKSSAYLQNISYLLETLNIENTQFSNNCKSANLFILKNYKRNDE